MKDTKIIIIFALTVCLLFEACDHGDVGNADQTNPNYPGGELFEERMNFFNGVWDSGFDGYRIRKWGDIKSEDKSKAQGFFPSLNINSPKTYSTKDTPKNNDYVLLFDDGGGWGFCYMGLVRTINVFNNDINRGAIIIEYFEGADPAWLSDQGLFPGEKPFFGVLFNVLDADTVQFANPVEMKKNYIGIYHTEQKALLQAINTFNVVNEAEFVNWGGIVIPHSREK